MRISDWSSDVCSSDLPAPCHSWGRDHPFDLVPRRARHRDVAGAVLRAPGEVFAHRLEFDIVREGIEHRLFTSGYRALDELDDADLPSVADGPTDHSRRRAGLALANRKSVM